MRELKREVNTPRFVPDYMAQSLLDIDFVLLKKRGIKFIAFDADSTLVPFRGVELTAETKKFLLSQKKLFPKWCLATNRLPDNLRPLGKSIDAEVIRATLLNRKPHRRYFQKVLNYLDAKPHEVAMVGDKLLADMFGAKRMGLVTVWVEHFGRDSIVDRLTHLRKFEKQLLKNYVK